MDLLFGTSGDDNLFGGLDNDILFGGKGNDALWGDSGEDLFVFHPGDGDDVINDFNANQGDKIDFSEYNTDFATLQSVISQSGNDTIINVGALDGGTPGDSVTLSGVTAASVSEADFVL